MLAPRALILAGLVFGLAAPVLAQAPSTPREQRWIIAATHADRDHAIGIARATHLSDRPTRVVRDRHGAFLVAIGPVPQARADRVRRDLVRDEAVAADATVSSGETFAEVVWRPSSAVLARASYAGRRPVTARDGEFQVTLDRRGSRAAYTVRAIGRLAGREIFDIEVGDQDTIFDFGRPGVPFTYDIQLVRLSRATPLPQVVVSHYTGGAHCCVATTILTQDATGAWVEIEAPEMDGDMGYAFEDLDGDGEAEAIRLDQRFLYNFASYADSRTVALVDKLEDGRLVDVTTRPPFTAIARQDLAALEWAIARKPAVERTSPGYLGAWVAAQARLGRYETAFREARATFDRSADFAFALCDDRPDGDDCPADRRRDVDFPTYLHAFLRANGFVPPDTPMPAE